MDNEEEWQYTARIAVVLMVVRVFRWVESLHCCVHRNGYGYVSWRLNIGDLVVAAVK